jgi:hypothetical protein
VTANLVSNLSDYTRTDYRRFLSAHLQFLRGLCQMSMVSMNNSIAQFLASFLITTELLSPEDFLQRLNTSIEHEKLQAPTTLSEILFLIRSINHGNAIISTYGTNFEYITPWATLKGTYAPTQAFIYDDGCSCGLYSNCTSQANFIARNASEWIAIKGLKVGCLPSEAFLASTLECFYNLSCIQLIQQFANSTNDSHTLSSDVSQLSVQTTIAKLVDSLFTEKWTVTMNYSSYFQQCLPVVCAYTYTQRVNLIHLLTGILGFQGGLSIALQRICPQMVQFMVKIFQYRQKRRNAVGSTSFHPRAAHETTNTNVNNVATGYVSLISLAMHYFLC